MTNVEKVRNQRAIEHAIAQQTLEGLVVPPEAMNDLQSMARGEMTLAEALHAASAEAHHFTTEETTTVGKSLIGALPNTGTSRAASITWIIIE